MHVHTPASPRASIKERISLSLCLALLVVSAACGRKADTGTTTASTGVRVTDVSLGRAIGGDKAITDATDTFN